MRFRFLHAADLHLDTPFSRLTGVPERVATRLRDASLRAFERLIEVAIEEKVAFVVLAGDIYDGAERGVRAQLAFRDGLARLAEVGIQTFVVYGNHDPINEGWSAIDSFPPEVTVFGADEVGRVEVRLEDTVAATVSGISYGTSAETEYLSLRFPPASGRGFHVAVLHANVGGRAEHGPYSPCTLDDLRAGGYDYWALGHIHRRAELSEAPPHIVYPGNLQGRSPKPSEQGAKGAVIVDVDGKVATPRFIPLDTVRFDSVEVSIEGLDLDDLEQALVDAATACQVAADDRPLIVRGRVVGHGDLHDELASVERRSEVLLRLRDLERNSDPFIWWDDLSWRTKPAIDIAERAGGDDFIGDLLRAAEAQGAASEWVPAIGVEYRNWLADRTPSPQDAELFDEAVTTALVSLLEQA